MHSLWHSRYPQCAAQHQFHQDTRSVVSWCLVKAAHLAVSGDCHQFDHYPCLEQGGGWETGGRRVGRKREREEEDREKEGEKGRVERRGKGEKGREKER